jgi:membrane protease YdiL (CAAX protease family)
VTRRRSGGTNREQGGTRSETRFALDPYFACLIFAAVGLGTLKLDTSPRLIILWTTLLGLWIVFREGQTMQVKYDLTEIGRGTAIGLAMSVPLTLIAFQPLVTAIPILYISAEPSTVVGASATTIFASLVLVAPLAEELFFRDVLQRNRGFWIAVALYAVAGIIFFLPTAGNYAAVLAAVSGASAVLGILYAFLYERYGLTVALACHTTLNLVLLFVPAIVGHLELLAR